MDNEITINIAELLEVEDNSITDYETIRQIGLLSCTRNIVSEDDRKILNRKIKTEFQFAALYPNVMKSFDILPDGISEETARFFKSIMNINRLGN